MTFTHQVRTLASLLELAVRAFLQDHLTTASAAIAFYAFLSGFPLLLLAVIASASVIEPWQAAGRLDGVLREYMPIGSQLVEDAAVGAVRAGGATVGISVLALMWSGTRVFAHTIRALNYVWGVEHNYRIRTRFLLYPVLVMLAVALLALGLMYKVLVAPLWATIVGEPDLLVWHLLGDLLEEVLGLAIVLLLYRYLPRRSARWRDAFPGALLAWALFQGSQELFQWYALRFGYRYAMTYGSLHDVAVLLLWAYISAVIFLFGAELGSVYGRWRDSGSVVEEAALVASLRGVWQ